MTVYSHAESRTPDPPPHQSARAQSHLRADNLRKDHRNVFATMAVFGGIASWVPLVIVVAFPLTLVCGALAIVTSIRGDQRRGLKAAGIGVLLAISALLVHLLFAFVGLLVSYLFPLFQSLFGA